MTSIGYINTSICEYKELKQGKIISDVDHTRITIY